MAAHRRARLGTNRTQLERLAAAMDKLEGYPRQSDFADGTPAGPEDGWTYRAGYIAQRGDGTLAYICDVEFVQRHDGKTSDDGTTVRSTDFVEADDEWEEARK